MRWTDAEGKPQRVNVVTFLCTPDDAAKVILAASEGRIQLVLRNAVDKDDEEQLANKDLPKVGRRELYAGGAPPPRPVAARRPPPPIAPPAPEPVSIMMIRGSNVSNVELEAENR